MTEPIVVADRTFKIGDRVVVCSPTEMGNEHPAWAISTAGEAGTIVGWDAEWWAWRVAMDEVPDAEPARFLSTYLKPEITRIEDVDRYLAAS